MARRRLELLSAELAATRPDATRPPSHPARGGSGEPPPLDRRPVSVAAPGRHARRERRGAEVAAWLQDRLPASLQGRARIGAPQLAAVAMAAAAAMALLAWSTVRAADPGELAPARAAAVPGRDADGALVTPAALPTGAAPPGAPSAAPSSAPAAGEVVVDVAGKVRRPGIVTLPVGSRVVDALEAAGGARRGADLTGLNLARVLVDGEQVVVGVPAPAGIAPPLAAGGADAPAPVALVNINTAAQAELESLPGVGPVTAQAILQWRAENGAFSSVDELLEVSGIGDATLAEIAPFVTL